MLDTTISDANSSVDNSSAVTDNENEAHFLENQRIRQAALVKNSGRRRKDKLNEFWAEVREQLAQWRDRLLQRRQQSIPTSSSDCQQAIKDLGKMYEEMKVLQKNAIRRINIELTVTDLKLLHDEFVKCRKQLEDAREYFSLNNRFSFKRYRAALKEEEEQQKMLLLDDNNNKNKALLSIENNNETPQQIFHQSVSRSIEDLSDVHVYENDDGTLEVTSNQETAKIVLKKEAELDSTALIMQNLNHCEIFINIMYHSVHLINVKHSKINLGGRVDGALHITNCTDTTIHGSSQQLRIHESSNLQFYRFCVDTGAILEDSTDICFFTSGDDTTLLTQTKDFDWFRIDKPSPNFRVEIIPPEEDKKKCNNKFSKTQISSETTAEITEEEEESDEDEI